MSKFIDKLKRLSLGEPQPIGFRATQPVSPKEKMQLIAGISEENAEHLADCVAGADAGLLRISKMATGINTLQEASQAIPDIPWGGWLQGSSVGQTKQLVKAGCDFVAFTATSTPLAIIQGDDIGKILVVEASLSEGLMRAANELPIDAVLVSDAEREGDSLTWEHLLILKRFADLIAKPLLVSIPLKVMAGELQALWEAGIDGVVVTEKAGQPPTGLSKLRQVIEKLDFPSPRKLEKVEPLLPRVSSGLDAPGIEEDEDEDEEE